MKIYADTNFIARLYLPQFSHEFAADTMQALHTGALAPLPLTPLLEMEVTNAWELYVFFGKQPHHPIVSPAQAAAAHADFRDDIRAGLIYRPEEVPSRRLVRAVEELTLRHTARHGCRAYDLIHVASALELDCREFWTFDLRAMSLAEKEGLTIPPPLKRLARRMAK